MNRLVVQLFFAGCAIMSPAVHAEATDRTERSGGSAPLAVETVAALKALGPKSRVAGMEVKVGGYYRGGDGGGGVFRYDPAATGMPDGGTVFQPDLGKGRWTRRDITAVNVRWFGARGDDGDDTAALAAAVAAGAGKTIVLPAGTFVIHERLRLQANTVFEGDGDASVLKLKPDFPRDSDAVYAGGATHVVIRNFKIDCAALGTNAIALQGCTDSEVSGMTIQSPFHCGILAYDEAYRIRIVRNTVIDQKRPTGFAICLFHGASSNEVRGNTIKDHTGIGILVDDGTVDQPTASSDDNLVSDNVVAATRHGGFSIIVEGSDRNTVTNNRIDCASTYAIDIACGNSAPVVTPKNNTVAGNIITAAVTGIRLQGENNAVTANRITAGNMGVDLQNSGTNTNLISRNVVSDNIIGPVAGSSQPVQCGVFVDDASAHDNRIIRNTIFGCGRCGIRHENGTATEIAYNFIRSVGTCGVLFDRSVSGASIHDNVIWSGSSGWSSRCYGICFDSADLRFVSIHVHDNWFASDGWFARGEAEMVVRGTAARYVDCSFADNTWLGPIAAFVPLPETDSADIGQVIRSLAVTSGAIAPTPSAAQVFVTKLTSNIRVLPPEGAKAGQRMTFILVQDGAGGRTVEWDPVFRQRWTDEGNTRGRKSVITFVFENGVWMQLGSQFPYS